MEIFFETLASDLLRTPEGLIEVPAYNEKDDTPLTKSKTEARMENENIFNCAVSTESDEVEEPDVEFEDLSTSKIGLDNKPMTDDETSSALTTGGTINSGLIHEIDRVRFLAVGKSSRKQLH